MRMPADPRQGGAPSDLLDLVSPRRIHIVGIGGAGMSAIALVLRDMGHDVSGSDLKDSPVAERLRSLGIEVAVGHRAENVVGAEALTYSPAVPPENVELVEARARGILVVPRSEMLAAICATRRCLAVAGTHGKTTTASMLSLILVEAGMRPSFLIGADVNEIGTNAVWDTGDWLVVEADESYGTFQALRPDLAILTSVEPDHLDYYGTFDALRDAFARFVGLASTGAVVCVDDPEADAIGEEQGAVGVGMAEGATYRMRDLEQSRSSSSFSLHGPAGELGSLRIGVPGVHNARNAAVAAVAALRAGAPFEAVQSALARFAGVTRRFEFRGEARRGDLRRRLRPPARRGAHGPRDGQDRWMGSHRGRLPATPLLADRGAGRAVRHRVRRRGRARRDRHLQRRRAPGPRCLGEARGRCRPGAGPAAARGLRPRLGGDAPGRRGRSCARATSASRWARGTSRCSPTHCSNRPHGDAERRLTVRWRRPSGTAPPSSGRWGRSPPTA